LLIEVGRQAGMREQKLDDIHKDIKHIRENMALQAKMSEFQDQANEKLVKVVEVMTAAKTMILEKLEILQTSVAPILRNETTLCANNNETPYPCYINVEGRDENQDGNYRNSR
jgi:hypothetical protein